MSLNPIEKIEILGESELDVEYHFRMVSTDLSINRKKVGLILFW